MDWKGGTKWKAPSLRNFIATVFVLGGIMFSIASGTGCGGSFTDLEGTLTSPGFPGNYPNDQSCVYTITVPTDYRITLTFHQFELEGKLDGTCLDSVGIRDGGDQVSPLFNDVIYCQSRNDSTLLMRSTQNRMWIRFRSNEQGTYRGFNATYTTDTLGDDFVLANWQEIVRIDLFTFSYIEMSLTKFDLLALAFDPVSFTVYFTDGADHSIHSVFLNSTDRRRLLDLDSNATLPFLAMDSVSGLLFYTDTGNNVIGVVSTSTGAHRRLVTGQKVLGQVAVDTELKLLFWIEGTMIQRSNYNGGERRTLVELARTRLQSVTVDVDNHRVFWLDTDDQKRINIEYMTVNGDQRTRSQVGVTTDDYRIERILYHNGYVYLLFWDSLTPTSQPTSSAIRRMRHVGQIFFLVFTSSVVVEDFIVYNQSVPQSASHSCRSNNGGCSHLCITSSQSGYACMCPDGQEVTSDNRTCAVVVPSVPTTIQTTISSDAKRDATSDIVIGASVGGAVGVVVIVVLIIIVVVVVKRRANKRQNTPKMNYPTNASSNDWMSTDYNSSNSTTTTTTSSGIDNKTFFSNFPRDTDSRIYSVPDDPDDLKFGKDNRDASVGYSRLLTTATTTPPATLPKPLSPSQGPSDPPPPQPHRTAIAPGYLHAVPQQFRRDDDDTYLHVI